MNVLSCARGGGRLVSMDFYARRDDTAIVAATSSGDGAVASRPDVTAGLALRRTLRAAPDVGSSGAM